MREMTPWVQIKTNYSFGVLLFLGGFTGGSSEWGKYGCKKKQAGCRERVMAGEGGLAPGGACENQWPLGKPAELNYQENTVAKGSRKDTASICHTLTAGKRECRREREGWVAD